MNPLADDTNVGRRYHLPTGGPKRLHFDDGDAADGMYGSHLDREESYEDR